jgi:hypothetical protein
MGSVQTLSEVSKIIVERESRMLMSRVQNRAMEWQNAAWWLNE